MKVLVFGENKAMMERLAARAGFKIVKKNPQFVISYGGDGTLMKAESAFPGIPKIILKDSHVCKKCSTLSNEEVLEKIKKNKFSIEELGKLEVSARGKKLYAINDVILHNKDARHAIRYSFSVNGRLAGRMIIGDGIVVATPFGSTGYYRSITDSFFELGIGLAFNNSTEQADHMVLKEDSIIKIEIMRGPAVIYADNQKKEILLEAGSEVVMKKSKNKALIVVPELFI